MIIWFYTIGMFIAKISRGRTIRNFINGTISIPVAYTFAWMVLFGGIGIRQERAALQMGLCCAPTDDSGNRIDTNWFIDLNNQTLIYHVNPDFNPTDVIGNATANPADYYWMCVGNCTDCAINVISIHQGVTYNDFLSEYSTLGADFGSTSEDRTVVRLSCHEVEQQWFDVMRSFDGIGYFLAIFSLLGIVLYFVTSADSGALVIVCLSCNGDPDPPPLQKIFWAFMEGATATALLVAGGANGLAALQSASIASALPYTVVVCLICTAIWRAVKVGAGDLDPNAPTFACGLFDPLAAEPTHK